jgi:hypothetical protein
VLATTREESRASWSPDGEKIAFNSDRRGEMNLGVRTLADGSERQLTSGPGGDPSLTDTLKTCTGVLASDRNTTDPPSLVQRRKCPQVPTDASPSRLCPKS